ncbi:MAG: MFS transporter [bacterium]
MRRSPLAIILLTVFIALIGFGIVIPLIPVYAERYGASGMQVGMLIMVYSLMQFIFAPLAGRLSDKIGRRPVLIGALIITSSSYVLFALSHNLHMLFISRILAGLGGADITVAQAYIADVTPPEKRARGMGLFGAAFGVGFVVGPALTGVTAPLAEWLPAAIAAVLAGTTAIVAMVLLPEPSTRAQRASTALKEPYRASKPVITISAVYFLVTFSVTQFQAMIVLFTLKLFGWGASKNGLFIAGFATLGAIIQGGFMGRLAARFGERNLTRTGLILVGLGLTLAGNAGQLVPPGGVVHFGPTLADLLTDTGRLWVLFGGALVYAIGFAVTIPSLSTQISQRSPQGRQGQALGIYQSSGSFGRIVGPVAGGFLFDHIGIAAPMLAGGAVAILTGIASIVLFAGAEWAGPPPKLAGIKSSLSETVPPSS